MGKKFAAHQLIMPDKSILKREVVELENHIVVRHFPLTEEIAFTEWIGGAILLSPNENGIKQITFPIQMNELLEQIHQEEKVSATWYAWHISANDLLTGTIQTLKKL